MCILTTNVFVDYLSCDYITAFLRKGVGNAWSLLTVKNYPLEKLTIPTEKLRIIFDILRLFFVS